MVLGRPNRTKAKIARQAVPSCTVLFLFLLTVALARGQGKTGTLTGMVRDSTGEPEPFVNISLEGKPIGTASAINGTFELTGIPPGEHRFRFSKLGFEKVRREITIQAGKTRSLKITLERSDQQLEELVITGTPKAMDPIHTPTNVDAIAEREKLEKQKASLGETVQELPGVNSISTGGHSGKPVIRGLSGNRIRVLMEGIPMDFQQFGVRHMPNVDPFTARRIEVVQGPSSILYGSDALGGAVNILSPELPHSDSGKGSIQGRVLGGYHSNNDEWTSGARLSGSAGNWGATAIAVYREGGNIRTPDLATARETGKSSDPKFTGELPHTDHQQLNGHAGIGYQGQQNRYSLHYTRWDNAHNFLLPNGEGLGQALTNDVLRWSGKIRLNEKWQLQPNLSYLRNTRLSNKPGKTRDEIPQKENAWTDILLQTYTGRVQLKHDHTGYLSGKLGTDLKFQEQDSRGTGVLLVPPGTVKNLGVFAFEQYDRGKWNIAAGLRYDRQEQKTEASTRLQLPDTSKGETMEDLRQSYDIFSASLGVNYALLPKLSLAGNLARGFRAPSFFDLHVHGVHGGVAAFQTGDPDLSPETSLNKDLSVKWKSERSKARATIYHNRIRNYIYMVNTGTFKGQNGPPVMRTIQGNAVLKGGHVGFDTHPWQWLGISGSFETVKGENKESGQPLPLLPATRVSGELRWITKNWKGFERIYVKSGIDHAFKKEAAGRFEPFWQFDRERSFGVASTAPYTLLHAGFGFDLDLFREEPVTFDVNVHNLTDLGYREFLDTYKGYALSPGRNVHIHMTVPF